MYQRLSEMVTLGCGIINLGHGVRPGTDGGSLLLLSDQLLFSVSMLHRGTSPVVAELFHLFEDLRFSRCKEQLCSGNSEW